MKKNKRLYIAVLILLLGVMVFPASVFASDQGAQWQKFIGAYGDEPVTVDSVGSSVEGGVCTPGCSLVIDSGAFGTEPFAIDLIRNEGPDQNGVWPIGPVCSINEGGELTGDFFNVVVPYPSGWMGGPLMLAKWTSNGWMPVGATLGSGPCGDDAYILPTYDPKGKYTFVEIGWFD